MFGLFLAIVAGDPADYYHEKRPLLVQPVPEPKPICHVEYDVRFSHFFNPLYQSYSFHLNSNRW